MGKKRWRPEIWKGVINRKIPEQEIPEKSL
jgi:hypothetical protein